MSRLFAGMIVGVSITFLSWFIWMLIGLPQVNILSAVFMFSFMWGAIKNLNGIGYSSERKTYNCEVCGNAVPEMALCNSISQRLRSVFNCDSCGSEINRFGLKYKEKAKSKKI